jgi:arabinogalactan oligomer/maltooligosaccharide transport system permease protein
MPTTTAARGAEPGPARRPPGTPAPQLPGQPPRPPRRPPQQRPGQRSRRGQRSLPASVALHATLITATVIAVFPVAWVVLTSLKPASGWQSTELRLFSDPTLDNYRQVLTETKFLRWFANSLIISGLTTAVGLFLAATAGYALSRMRFPGHRPLMTAFLVTQMFPVAILIVPIYNIMAALRLLNTYGGLVLAYCTVAVPFCAWMLKGYFDTIPT